MVDCVKAVSEAEKAGPDEVLAILERLKRSAMLMEMRSDLNRVVGEIEELQASVRRQADFEQRVNDELARLHRRIDLRMGRLDDGGNRSAG